MRSVNVILFDDFETLDAFGPAEILGRLDGEFSLRFFSLDGGIILGSQKVPVMTEAFSALDARGGTLFIPGGNGTRALVKNGAYASALRSFAEISEYVLTVCTGSILFSKTGLLDGRNATSNKRVFQWTALESPAVCWIRKARWVRDGNIYTSSGVSAGMDMALGFIADLFGVDIARAQACGIEYLWNEDPTRDPFSEFYGK